VKTLLAELRKTRSVKAAFLIFIGWILSPFTFWNDALVNIPIAYFCASVVALLSEKLFFVSFLAAYWLTNIVGVVMMGEGIRSLMAEKKIGRHPVVVSLITTAVYTVAVTCLFYAGMLRPIDFSVVGRLFHR